MKTLVAALVLVPFLASGVAEAATMQKAHHAAQHKSSRTHAKKGSGTKRHSQTHRRSGAAANGAQDASGIQSTQSPGN